MKRMKQFFVKLSLLALGGVAGVLATQHFLNQSEAAPPPKIVVDQAPVNRDGRLTTSFAPVVKKVSPSVVSIYTTKTVIIPPSLPNLDIPLLPRFFDEERQRPGRQPESRQRERQARGLGSGVIVSKDGYILTNNHVVEGADDIKVVLSDKSEYTATVIGTDPPSDVAVLKIDAKDLPAITITDSDNLQVGDIVLAVGNPFDLSQTVTMGIVSAKGRGGFGIVEYEDFIQTDASINRGNSGGALVDGEGRLVGINTAIITPTGVNTGVGFAIPINMARNVMDLIVSEGRVARGYLGIYIQPVTPDLAKAFNLPDQHGALISSVGPKTPAADAGLKEGDVVIEFNGKKIQDSRQLQLQVSQTPPKTKATLKILRDGKEKTINATLGELPAEELASTAPPGLVPQKGRLGVLEGVEMTDLNSKLRRQFEIPDHISGALVTNIDPTSAAFMAGLRSGDVILGVNRQSVENSADAMELSKSASGDQAVLRVWSRGGTRYLVVDLSKRKDR